MRMTQREYRIGELAKKLNVEKFVIRFWEKEFNISSHRSKGGQRFYKDKDFEKFQLVKSLLYEKKYTIAGAKKELEQHKHTITSQGSIKVNASRRSLEQKQSTHSYEELCLMLLQVKKQLEKLKALL